MGVLLRRAVAASLGIQRRRGPDPRVLGTQAGLYRSIGPDIRGIYQHLWNRRSLGHQRDESHGLGEIFGLDELLEHLRRILDLATRHDRCVDIVGTEAAGADAELPGLLRQRKTHAEHPALGS